MISVIVCTIDPVKSESIKQHYQKLLKTDWEFIPIHNPRSMAAGYNEGIALSVGDILIFSHDDIEFLQEDFAGTLDNHMRYVDVLGVAGTDLLTCANWIQAGAGHLFGQVAHPRPSGFGVCRYGTGAALANDCVAVDGCWVCVKREVAESIRYDDETFDGFHCYDLDFSLRAHLTRYRVGVASDLFPIHYSGGTYDANWREACKMFEWKHRESVAGCRKVAKPFTSVQARDKADVLRIMQGNLKHEPAHNQSGTHHDRPPVAPTIA